MNSLILQYAYLQVLDLLTTVAFLINGVQEANPLVRGMMRFTSSPVAGLLLVKLVALALGVYCWRVGKYQLLGRINILFALLVAWNMLALIAGSAS
ncbi:MAG: DUF5658 family protein [Bryobacteraceae bacterium]